LLTHLVKIAHVSKLGKIFGSDDQHYAQIPHSQDHLGVRSAVAGSVAIQEPPTSFHYEFRILEHLQPGSWGGATAELRPQQAFCSDDPLLRRRADTHTSIE
jgi:hypothetical protein